MPRSSADVYVKRATVSLLVDLGIQIDSPLPRAALPTIPPSPPSFLHFSKLALSVDRSAHASTEARKAAHEEEKRRVAEETAAEKASIGADILAEDNVGISAVRF